MNEAWTVLPSTDSDSVWKAAESTVSYYHQNPTAPSADSRVLITTLEQDERDKERRRNGKRPGVLDPNKVYNAFPSTLSFPSEEETGFSLLQKPCDGFDLLPARNPARIKLEQGSILRIATTTTATTSALNYLQGCLKDGHKSMQDCDVPDRYGNVPANQIMQIRRDEAQLLLPLSKERRIELYHDFQRFCFITGLKKGDEVVARIRRISSSGESEEMERATIVGKGQRPPQNGHFFTLNVHASPPLARRAVDARTDSSWPSPHPVSSFSFATADDIFPPHTPLPSFREMPVAASSSLSSSSAALHQRNGEVIIPITRLPQPPLPLPRTKVGISLDYPRHPISDFDFVDETSSVSQQTRVIPIQRRERASSSNQDDLLEEWKASPSPSVPSRPSPSNQDHLLISVDPPRMNHAAKSSYTRDLPPLNSTATRREREVCRETKRVETASECEGWREGDRCVWQNNTRDHTGTLRFIGYLAGHASLYGGVEFDEPVGQGTGTFHGQELFTTNINHAGFVMLSTLRRPPPAYHRVDPSRRPLSGMAQSPPVTSVGSSDGLGPPPRPLSATSAHPVGSISLSSKERSTPPPVPPRPKMVPEDFMIDSFGVGSCVDVVHLGASRCGVVKWVGDALNHSGDRLERSAVVELEVLDVPDTWRLASQSELPVDTTVNSVLVPLSALRRDRRFVRESSLSCEFPGNEDSGKMNGDVHDFGSVDSGIETNRSEPAKVFEDLIGRMKGIQGHRNSCYLDATLYALFVQSSSFDHVLTRKRGEADIPEYDELQRVLATEIVYPLRKFHYVRADHVMLLRKLLDKLIPSVKGLTSEEKDPEEVLSVLFRDLFKSKPFVQLICCRDGRMEGTWLYHLALEKEWHGGITTSQHLLEKSMRRDHLKFAQCPQVLMLLLPRYGTTKIFDKIVPLESIDITAFVHNVGFACCACNKVAELQCDECYLTRNAVFRDVCFCANCFRTVHAQRGQSDHCDRPLAPNARPVKKTSQISMTLSSVLCIETSHYVSFVRSQQGRWMFFDSMADRQGLSDGFNIPQVRECEKATGWLSRQGFERLREEAECRPPSGKSPVDDPLVNRLLNDAYMCVYCLDPQPPSGPSTLLNTNILRNLLNR